MLLIKRKANEGIIVRHCGETLVIRVHHEQQRPVRLLFDGTKDWRISREELVGGSENEDQSDGEGA